jgi:hypothetical protein
MQQVEIIVEGQIDETWVEWFEGFSLTYTERNQTILVGDVSDQSALYGTITRLRDLGLDLISVNLLKGNLRGLNK